jgi:hypothetical protein
VKTVVNAMSYDMGSVCTESQELSICRSCIVAEGAGVVRGSCAAVALTPRANRMTGRSLICIVAECCMVKRPVEGQDRTWEGGASAAASTKYLPISLRFDSFILPLEDVNAARDY